MTRQSLTDAETGVFKQPVLFKDEPYVHYIPGSGFCLHPGDEDEPARLTYSAVEVIAHLADYRDEEDL